MSDSKTNGAEKHGDDIWPIGKKSAYYTCFVAFFLGLFDLIDRQMMASLFPYLKAEYALSDAQLGSLFSIASVAIAVLVVPSAYFIDRWSRKKMMFVMGTIWSAATLACAFAGTYSHLFMARFVCGAGEAGYNPAVQSLLAASFPKRLRTTAAGIAQLGMGLGVPTGLVLGAYIATHWGWRHAFGIVALPGFIFAILALRIKDFKNPPTPAKRDKEDTYAAALITMLRTPSMLCIFIGAAMLMLYTSMQQAWLPTYYNRVAQFPLTTSSLIAASSLITGNFAAIACGPVVDILRRKKANRGILWLFLSMFLAGVLAVLVFGVLPLGSVSQIVVLIAIGLCTGAVTTVGLATILDLTTPNRRGSAVSLCILVQNIFGMAAGPFVGGLLSDMFDLPQALLISSGALFIAAAAYGICLLTYERDIARVKQVELAFE